MGEASGGALRSSTFCCCISEIISFRNLFSVFFLKRISAEERRSGYQDVNFGCGHRNLMIVRSYVDAVSCFKMICNSGDQPGYTYPNRCPLRKKCCLSILLTATSLVHEAKKQTCAVGSFSFWNLGLAVLIQAI